ncbi:hypothetical protein RHSIM_Rhsim10G0145900 [Rhododendron simsii]|uniref:Uncharacterized protein n=1 Tax=Rhododendron simsii TaxID=118357 RepID=A0A834GEP8_RHOSS|nr:hypothetical protein RHSIM_Rhsim10G0145900 [Rhododendron simsii]
MFMERVQKIVWVPPNYCNAVACSYAGGTLSLWEEIVVSTLIVCIPSLTPPWLDKCEYTQPNLLYATLLEFKATITIGTITASIIFSTITGNNFVTYISVAMPDLSTGYRGRGCAKGVKQWGTRTMLELVFDDNFLPLNENGSKLKEQIDNVKDCPEGFYPVAMRACNEFVEGQQRWRQVLDKMSIFIKTRDPNDSDVKDFVRMDMVIALWVRSSTKCSVPEECGPIRGELQQLMRSLDKYKRRLLVRLSKGLPLRWRNN